MTSAMSKQELNSFCLISWEGKDIWQWALSIDRVLSKEIFYAKLMQKTCPKS